MGPGRALPVPAKLFQPHVVSDSPQLPWNIGIIDILEVVLINPGDVDPSGVATVATSPRPRLQREQGGVCQQPLRIYSSLENPLIPLRAPRGFCFPLQIPGYPKGNPLWVPVGVWGSRGKPPGRVQAARAASFITGGIKGDSSHLAR